MQQQQDSKQPKQEQQQQQGAPQQGSQVEGEGSYTAAHHHREQAEQFVKSGQMEQAARDAAPKNEQEAQDMQKAEQEGLSHRKG